jgi:hypothetical protein
MSFSFFTRISLFGSKFSSENKIGAGKGFVNISPRKGSHGNVYQTVKKGN